MILGFYNSCLYEQRTRPVIFQNRRRKEDE